MSQNTKYRVGLGCHLNFLSIDNIYSTCQQIPDFLIANCIDTIVYIAAYTSRGKMKMCLVSRGILVQILSSLLGGQISLFFSLIMKVLYSPVSPHLTNLACLFGHTPLSQEKESVMDSGCL